MPVASSVGRWISHGSLRQVSTHTGRPRAPLRKPPQLRLQHTDGDSSYLPRVAQPSLWQNVVPKVLRNGGWRKLIYDKNKKKNPASYFIWIYLFIGSQAIRIIGVQNEFNMFMRKAEVKIDRLREVVEKLKKGEEVDVERALGTGDEAQEREWEDAIKEIEMEDQLWQNNKKKEREEKAKLEAETQDASPVSESEEEGGKDVPVREAPGFY